MYPVSVVYVLLTGSDTSSQQQDPNDDYHDIRPIRRN